MTKVIHNPALASIDEHSATSATFVIEPLHAGYGNTLGNSLRRVLLSSISGGAIVAFKIEGASHEFTTVTGIKEDVVDQKDSEHYRNAIADYCGYLIFVHFSSVKYKSDVIYKHYDGLVCSEYHHFSSG